MAFCASCGSPLTGGVKFCSKCGIAVSAPLASPAIAGASSAAIPQGSSALAKILWATLALILLLVLAAMGSCVYIAYRVKKKADEIAQAYKHSDAAGIVQTITGAGNDKPAKLPDWKPAAPDLAGSPAGKIPAPRVLAHGGRGGGITAG